MKLTILGTSAAYSGKNEGCPSYLISSNGKHYLLDAGPGCVSLLQNYIRITDINAIFLSHLHADHVSDIYTLRYAVYIAQHEGLMQQHMPIYMPKSPRKTYRFIKETIKKEFTITEITEKLKLHLNGMDVSFKKTVHPVNTFAVRFEAFENDSSDGFSGNKTGEKTIVYTSDTGFFEELSSFSSGSHILLAEATFQNSDKKLENLGHMTAEQAGELATKAGAEKLILTHIIPPYDKNISLKEAKRSFAKDIVIAERGQEFTL